MWAELLGGSGAPFQLRGRWKASILPSNMGVKDQSITDGLKRSEDGCRPAGQLFCCSVAPACCGGFARFIMAAAASACVSRNGSYGQAVSFTALTRLNVLNAASRWLPHVTVHYNRVALTDVFQRPVVVGF